MNNFNCIIIDNEPIASNILQEYIKRDERQILAAAYANASDALREIHLKKPMLMFLDLKMTNNSGFEMLRSVYLTKCYNRIDSIELNDHNLAKMAGSSSNRKFPMRN